MVDVPTKLTAFNDSIHVFRTELFTRGGCGNKEFKLAQNLAALHQQGARSVLTFGGVWSNHLHAFAHGCEALGLKAVAAVRGEEQVSTALLQEAARHGLTIHYLSRADYRLRSDTKFAEQLCESLACDAWLPEGGSNQLAVEGCRSIATMLNRSAAETPTHIVVAVGTGATMAGIICGAQAHQYVIGVPVVQDDRLPQQVGNWIHQNDSTATVRWSMLGDAEPPKYGKVNRALLEFVLQVHDEHGIVMDPVYNGKAFRALLKSDLVKNAHHKIVFVHTGGLGGCLGFKENFADLCGAGSADRYLADAQSMMNLQ